MSLEEIQIAVEERIAHPCYAEYRHHGIHAGAEDIAFDCIVHVCLAHQKDECGD